MDKFLEVSQIKLRGVKEVDGMRFHDIEGGFGKSKKSILVKEIANIHNRQLREVNQSINMNRKRFKDGIDILDLKGTEFAINLIDSGIYTQNSINASSNIYLLSERGYSKLLKIMDDDLAWDKYDELVDGYFNMRETINNQIPKILSPREQLELQLQVMKEQDKKIEAVKDEVADLRDNMPLLGVDCDEIVKVVKSVATKVLGGYKETPAYKDKSLNRKVYSDIYSQLKREFQVNSYKSIKRCQLEQAKENIRGYKLPTALADEIVQVNNQISF